MVDKYTKTVLTVIAFALVYLCIVQTPWPAAYAQSSARPGEPTGPEQVVVVGVRAPLPVAIEGAVPVVNAGQQPLRIAGAVTTERSAGNADRVVLVGWEQESVVDKARTRANAFKALTSEFGLPVNPK